MHPARIFETPSPVEVRDAVLGELLAPTVPGRIACRATTPGLKLRHIRADEAGEPADMLDVEPIPAGLSGDMPHVERAIYAGPYLNHFGHVLAEGVHRLWAAALPALRDTPVAFQVAADGHGPQPWFHDVLAMCGIAADRLLLIDRPTRFEALFVPAQGRSLKTGDLFAGYTTLFPLVDLPAPPGAARRLYVSRSRHIHSGSFLGESLIEQILQGAGFAIIHPQDMALPDLLGLLANAEQIVLAEGSAIHNLELCGPIFARVAVIGRRRNTELHYGRLLGAICADWTILPGNRPTVFLDWDKPSGQPRRGRGCSIAPIVPLIEALSSYFDVRLPVPDAASVNAAVREDLLRFLLHPLSGISSNAEELGRALRMIRDDPDVRALMADPE